MNVADVAGPGRLMARIQQARTEGDLFTVLKLGMTLEVRHRIYGIMEAREKSRAPQLFLMVKRTGEPGSLHPHASQILDWAVLVAYLSGHHQVSLTTVEIEKLRNLRDTCLSKGLNHQIKRIDKALDYLKLDI